MQMNFTARNVYEESEMNFEKQMLRNLEESKGNRMVNFEFPFLKNFNNSLPFPPSFS